MSTFTPEVAAIADAIAANLKALRKERGLTLMQMGEKLDLSYQQLARYESGESRLSAAFLCWIAVTLEVSVDRLLPSAE